MIDIKVLEELKSAPLALLLIKDQEVIDYMNNLIPYSSAFEIECDMGEFYDVDSFKIIPDIMSVTNTSSEQRYRIPNGIKGMICLYHICQQLKLNSELNPLSGIHYHVDCIGSFSMLDDKELLKRNAEWILKELDEWKYMGTQQRGIAGYTCRYHTGYWLRFNGKQTLEFRIGNMTFEYPILLRNIISANSIVRRLKEQIGTAHSTFKLPDRDKILTYAKNQLLVSGKNRGRLNYLQKRLNESQIKEEKPTIVSEEPTIIRNRTHKLK